MSGKRVSSIRLPKGNLIFFKLLFIGLEWLERIPFNSFVIGQPTGGHTLASPALQIIRRNLRITLEIVLIIISPAIMGIDPPGAAPTAAYLIQAAPLFPLQNPGLVSIPLGLITAIVVSLVTREEKAVETFSETNVRANLGIGAER